MPRPRGSWAGAVACGSLHLYPAAWRARYGDEVRALIEDSGADLRTIASLAWQAMLARIWPPRHLYDPPARMRASLATVAVTWTVLVGLAAVFASFTQAQPWLLHNLTGPRHLVIQWSYWVLDAAVGASLLAVAAGGLPLWLRMLRRARRQRRRREIAWLLGPAVVPVVYLGVASVILSLGRSPGLVPIQPPFVRTTTSFINLANDNVGPWWLMALGFAAGLLAAAGPGLALQSLRPGGPGVTLAARAAGLAVAAMGLAGAASIVAAVALHTWGLAPYRQSGPFAVYLLLFLAAIAAAATSATRGIRAARLPAAA
ncbi:MAG TPA: hypothetical protein VHY31_08795 [Streptosporangiaceae bacterium]|nr:hypothetical protein [Streptosporangiaceae bacterium]